jgi:hypothetical protein
VNPEQHRLVEPAALPFGDLFGDIGEEGDDAQREQEAKDQLDREREAEPSREAGTDLFAEQVSGEHEGDFTPGFVS